MSKAPSCKKCGGPCRAGELTAQQSPVAAAHAAGYAEAVADIRQTVETIMGRLRSAEMANLLMILDSGAHVGAAKKGEK